MTTELNPSGAPWFMVLVWIATQKTAEEEGDLPPQHEAHVMGKYRVFKLERKRRLMLWDSTGRLN